MNDSGSGSKSKRPLDDTVLNNIEEPPDVAKKRSRGPHDCLNYDESDEEEFTLFTQSNPEVVFEEPDPKPKLVFAKKSSAKKSSAKKSSKGKGAGKSSKSKNASKEGSSSEGKVGGNNELVFVLKFSLLYLFVEV